MRRKKRRIASSWLWSRGTLNQSFLTCARLTTMWWRSSRRSSSAIALPPFTMTHPPHLNWKRNHWRKRVNSILPDRIHSLKNSTRREKMVGLKVWLSTRTRGKVHLLDFPMVDRSLTQILAICQAHRSSKSGAFLLLQASVVGAYLKSGKQTTLTSL